MKASTSEQELLQHFQIAHINSNYEKGDELVQWITCLYQSHGFHRKMLKLCSKWTWSDVLREKLFIIACSLLLKEGSQQQMRSFIRKNFSCQLFKLNLCVVLFNLLVALDSVSREILLNKLKCELSFFQSKQKIVDFLLQKVRLHNQPTINLNQIGFFDKKRVPQGTILATLVQIVFLGYLYLEVQDAHSFIYVDGILIYWSDGNHLNSNSKPSQKSKALFHFSESVYRSTSSRLVDSRSLGQKTYQPRRQQTKNSRLKTSYTYITIFSLFIHKWYAVSYVSTPCTYIQFM